MHLHDFRTGFESGSRWRIPEPLFFSGITKKSSFVFVSFFKELLCVTCILPDSGSEARTRICNYITMSYVITKGHIRCYDASYVSRVLPRPDIGNKNVCLWSVLWDHCLQSTSSVNSNHKISHSAQFAYALGCSHMRKGICKYTAQSLQLQMHWGWLYMHRAGIGKRWGMPPFWGKGALRRGNEGLWEKFSVFLEFMSLRIGQTS